MTREELEKAITKTREQIYALNSSLNEVQDSKEKKTIQSRLRELQIRQLWYLDQLKAW